MQAHAHFPGLILGYGSIGRRHTRTLARLTSSLVIVNRRESVRQQAAQDHPTARVVAHLDALSDVDIDWAATVAVIATWGPSHAALFHALADRGVRHILCEKPLAHSVALAHGMVQRAREQGITLAVNHDVRYALYAAALRQLLTTHDLGAPVAVVVAGGAGGLVTNGIHWIDFATELFDAAPQQVWSSATGAAINPRAPELGFYGGTAVWQFAGGREAVISFNNQSSVAPTVQVYTRDAVAEVAYTRTVDDAYLHTVIRQRDPAAVAQFPAITRTGPATQVFFEGRLPGIRSFNEGIQAAIKDVAFGDGQTCSGAVGAAAVNTVIGALVAGRERTAVSLPLDPASAWGQECWPIS